jgi:hypothetical protein
MKQWSIRVKGGRASNGKVFEGIASQKCGIVSRQSGGLIFYFERRMIFRIVVTDKGQFSTPFAPEDLTNSISNDIISLSNYITSSCA